MVEPEGSDLLEFGPQAIEAPRRGERPYRKDLLVRGPTRADEVGVVGVRLTVGTRACRGDDRVLVEREHDVARPGFGEHVGDRLPALRVRDRVAAAVEERQRGKRGEELRAFDRRGADLEVRRPRTAQRATPEQRAPQVRGTTAGAPHHAARRLRSGAQTRSEDARLRQELLRARRSRHVHLIARRAVERAALVRSNLRLHTERAQDPECSARDRVARKVEVNRDFAAPEQVNAAGGVRETGQLGEAVAVARWSDRRELVAEVLRERHARASAACACRRRRATRTSRGRRPRPRDDTARRSRSGWQRRTSRPPVARSGVPRARRAPRRSPSLRTAAGAARCRRRGETASSLRDRARRRGNRPASLRRSRRAGARRASASRGVPRTRVSAPRCGRACPRRARARRPPSLPPRTPRSAPIESCPMSAPGLFRPPAPQNEPVKDYAPGSPERASLRLRLEEMRRDRLEIPLVIGGEDVTTGATKEAIAPHDKELVLADVHQGGEAEVELAIAAAGEAWQDWHRTPWEERAAVFLRAAELLAGPWRDTLVAATMLGQSKTSHQAEIDAAAELIDFWRWNVEFMLRIYAEQPVSSPGVWNRMEYRPLEGFVFAVTPFNFTAIAGNLPGSTALMGNTVVWKPATTAMLSAYWLMRLLQEAGLPPGVINLVYGSGPEIGDAALASPHLAGVHFTGSTPVFNGMWRTIGENISSGAYRNYPRIVGETGGKDFIVAHPSPNG